VCVLLVQHVFVITHKGKLYRSDDGGKSWRNQESKLNRHAKSPIYSMHINPLDHKKVCFVVVVVL